ncbi:MAG: shikimate kinase [Micropruina sp.]|uniref:shikimate kinase n=1 Tax=Micropruina sp. TaxID=2737536 RepID=UPI0039E4EB79
MSPARTIALIGAPGAGKSTVGRALADRLGLPFVDVDACIEAEQGRLLREIFADFGETRFRALERDASASALAEPGVVAVGSGAVLTADVAAALRDVTVIWLQVSVAQASRRLGLNQAGVLVLGNLRATLIRQLTERTPVYQNLATISVDTDHADVPAIVERIVAELKEDDR